MNFKIITFLAATFFFSRTLQGQNTVGVLSFDQPSEGYNLIFPHNQSTVFLLNNCGEVVHQWEDESTFRPGNAAYIGENGDLIKAKRPMEVEMPTFGAGGAGGIIEWRTWDNELLTSFSFMDTIVRAHHDIEPLPNGNVLAIIWERIPIDQVLAIGGDTLSHPVAERWPDYIVELDPITNTIVWEWHAWDHLIQDRDSTKENFGNVAMHPERIDINADLREFGLRPDWMHVNSIDYNEDLDQILLSVPNFNEIWIIDHSTTTAEAASSEGGNSGKGGDLLFRWGNPDAYNNGGLEDQDLFFQHNAEWVNTKSSSLYVGGISIFNNRVGEDSSHVNVILPSWDSNLQEYQLDENGRYLILSNSIINHPEQSFFSSGLSSAQVLENDNMLVMVGREGYAFEVTPSNEVVWEYKVPLRAGIPVEQGAALGINDNITFRMTRYPVNFSGFEGRDLTSQGTIESMPNLAVCTTTPTDEELEISPIKVYPNPANQGLIIEGEIKNNKVSIYDSTGRVIRKDIEIINQYLDVSNLESGQYWLEVDGRILNIVIQN